jgi:hypothetical protein
VPIGPGQGRRRRRGAGRGGADFAARLTMKCARLRAPYARQNWGQPRILGPARSARYDGRSEEREGEWGVPGARKIPPGLLRAGCDVAGADQSPLVRRPRDQMRLKVSPPSSSKRLA